MKLSGKCGLCKVHFSVEDSWFNAALNMILCPECAFFEIEKKVMVTK